MKVFFYFDDKEPIETEVTKHNGRVVQYKFESNTYIGFQFDDYHKPEDYTKENRTVRAFRGYLIGKKGVRHEETRMKIIEP